MGEPPRGPALPGSAVAVVAALIAVAALAGTERRLLPVASYAVALLVGAVGTSLRRRDRRVLGGATSLLGLGAGLASLGVAAALPGSLGVQVAMTAGLAGVTLFVLAVAPLRSGWSWGLALSGTVVLVGSVVLAVVLGAVDGGRAVVAVTMGLVAWDGAERARTLGEEVGRGAATASVEVARAKRTLAVGVAGGGIAFAAYGTAPAELPVPVLALLFCAALVCMAALFD